jgi:hypothetical protein
VYNSVVAVSKDAAIVLDMKSKYILVIRKTGRSASDEGWETIEPVHVKLWECAATLLTERKTIHKEQSFTIHFDWSPMIKRQRRHLAAMNYFFTGREKSLDERARKAGFPTSPTRVAVRSQDFNIAQNVIHDLFLIMNLAGPGCFDLYGASLLRDGRHNTDISLSNYHFEAALLVQASDKWPISRILDLSKVIAWYDAVRTGASQIPQNQMEKVLFALLHISKSDTSPMVVIWLFYAFESMLQTRVGENFSAIVSRIALLLNADKEQTQLIRKRIRALYDVRSAIVHGGFEVIHPMHDGSLDKRADDDFGDLIQALNYGYALLLASVQEVIERGWRFPIFDEMIRGHAI